MLMALPLSRFIINLEVKAVLALLTTMASQTIDLETPAKLAVMFSNNSNRCNSKLPKIQQMIKKRRRNSLMNYQTTPMPSPLLSIAVNHQVENLTSPLAECCASK